MNKKIVILVVIVECILAILLIAIIGKALENYYNEINPQDVYFTTADGDILRSGTVYKEKENVVEEIDNDRIVIEVARWDRGIQLYYTLEPENTSDRTVKFTSSDPENVTVDETGYVTFFEETDVTITITTKNGKVATVVLVPRQKKTTGTVEID